MSARLQLLANHLLYRKTLTHKKEMAESESKNQTNDSAGSNVADDSLRQNVERALQHIADLRASTEKYNDFGSVMGIMDEYEEIYRKFVESLHECSRRSKYLKRRIELWESGDRQVLQLSSPNKPIT